MRNNKLLNREASTHAGCPPQNAYPKDVETIDSIIDSMYAVISGPAGQKRDWDRFRSLFLPGARLILAVAQKGEKPRARVLDVKAYVRRTDPIFEKESFWESEKARKMQFSGTSPTPSVPTNRAGVKTARPSSEASTASSSFRMVRAGGL
jgi:hypothetical protein